jgi:hypothetical protein
MFLKAATGKAIDPGTIVKMQLAQTRRRTGSKWVRLKKRHGVGVVCANRHVICANRQ